MLEPDATARPSGAHGPPPTTFGPEALQILATEHWSLLASRSLAYTEAMSRASIFVAALSGAVVALALVAQADDFGSGFVAFALVLLPVVYFLGFVTIVRLGLELVALWTLISLIFHAVRLAQANAAAERGASIVSWLA